MRGTDVNLLQDFLSFVEILTNELLGIAGGWMIKLGYKTLNSPHRIIGQGACIQLFSCYSNHNTGETVSPALTFHHVNYPPTRGLW